MGAVTRRGLLAGTAAGGLLLAAGAQARGAFSHGVASGAFSHGVASGDPASDSVLLWTRVTTADGKPVQGTWQVARECDGGAPRGRCQPAQLEQQRHRRGVRLHDLSQRAPAGQLLGRTPGLGAAHAECRRPRQRDGRRRQQLGVQGDHRQREEIQPGQCGGQRAHGHHPDGRLHAAAGQPAATEPDRPAAQRRRP
ncbi:PhoD-like phosphatase N-terminal domain-containing protein [Pseudomonas aeruginosa]|nr:PhoD-like phosphatase N-terminal domain-containing protein [Pseudomonas aeruginosa]MBG4476623.1 PhoD-like phosphatase N-terminal domain-containing protein [Pseudomonas aeruginosa]